MCGSVHGYYNGEYVMLTGGLKEKMWPKGFLIKLGEDLKTKVVPGPKFKHCVDYVDMLSIGVI